MIARHSRRSTFPSAQPQRGLALIFVLIMMTMVFSIAAISSRIGTQGERMARADRDRQVALQGAEAALLDAEADIMDPRSSSRACKMLDTAVEAGCSSEDDTRGICAADSTQPDKQVYQLVDFNVSSDALRRYAFYGEFTSRESSFSASSTTSTIAEFGKPVSPPKYIIERVAFAAPITGVTSTGVRMPLNMRKDTGGYRVTALGYGYSRNTQVMLQAVIYSPVLANRCTESGLS